ncbi:hypothetical protein G7046_g3410 [Stylonectria norvegica]|nr:hypothetical protein G7046_g3410 [Stylonectria norvegica]
MAFTMHSHSGQFCPGHAQDQLEDIVRHAISVGYKTLGLTEHMPRYEERDLYPEEFIRPEYAAHVAALAAAPCVDYFIGSLHHVHSIPIDYDAGKYASAVAMSGSEERLFEDYYDLQHDMLQTLKPRIVGHFDLIRLMSAVPGRDVREWKGVWERVKRNLECVAKQGGWLECNSSALRKGREEPYPCREWLKVGGKFTFSDDSHGIAQVATNYARTVTYLESLGVEEVWTLQRTPHPGVEGTTKAKLKEVGVPLAVFRANYPQTL